LRVTLSVFQERGHGVDCPTELVLNPPITSGASSAVAPVMACVAIEAPGPDAAIDTDTASCPIGGLVRLMDNSCSTFASIADKVVSASVPVSCVHAPVVGKVPHDSAEPQPTGSEASSGVVVAISPEMVTQVPASRATRDEKVNVRLLALSGTAEVCLARVGAKPARSRMASLPDACVSDPVLLSPK
jgi:hypothetical protein